MDEFGNPIAQDDSNVIESEPVYTGSAPLPEPKAPVVVEPPIEPAEGEPVVAPAPKEGEEATPVVPAEPAEPVTEPTQMIDVERLNALRDAGRYNPTETNLEFLDEFGNLDPAKFGEFMAENNKNVFNQALNAFSANTEADKIETQAWKAVNEAYPELKDNPTLEKAIRGARIQDMISGGTGDLLELAKGVVGPIRDNRIKAVEDVNRTIEKQENLQVAKPTTAPVTTVTPTLIGQLKHALSVNDQETANRIRHAIRKERIRDTNNIAT